jgi:hypothetical protein
VHVRGGDDADIASIVAAFAASTPAMKSASLVCTIFAATPATARLLTRADGVYLGGRLGVRVSF